MPMQLPPCFALPYEVGLFLCNTLVLGESPNIQVGETSIQYEIWTTHNRSTK
jgi:hypothetical protein